MNLLRYIETNKKSFSEDPINKLDVLSLTWATYFNMSGVASTFPVSFPEFASDPYCRDLEIYHESFVPKTSAILFRRTLSSPRFKDCVLLAYDQVKDAEKDIQFGAIAFQAGGKIVVAFEGTDLSYVGWKEDCIISYSDSIGSYPLALSFLRSIMAKYEGPVILAGHSKGGNIAAYLLSAVKDDARIEKVYSYEGPGFRNPNVFSAHPERAKKLEKFVPQSAVVGILLNNEAEARIVKSRSVAVLQHNALKWVIKDEDFVYLQKRTISSRFVDKTANEWLNGLKEEERERFVGILFDSLEQTDARGFGQLVSHLANELPALYHAFHSLSPADRAFVRRVLRSLAKQALRSAHPKKKGLPSPS